MKRLFIAIPLPKQFLKAFSKYRDIMGKQTPWLRWTAVRNLHITVLFLGDVDEKAIPEVTKAIQGVCNTIRPFSLEFKNIVYAPPKQPPRMVWGMFGESTEYEHLTQSISQEIDVFMQAQDSSQKEKIPHITLARFKKQISPQKLIRLKNVGLEGETVQITSCILMESKLTKHGPIYKTIEEFNLGNG